MDEEWIEYIKDLIIVLIGMGFVYLCLYITT
jgi:hypothetical protein